MKKFLFLFIALLFSGLLFWHLSYFDFSKFHFYGFVDLLFSSINLHSFLHLTKYIPSLLSLAIYSVSLVFVGLLFEKIYTPFLILMLMEILLYFLVPETTFIFVGVAFALGTLMLLVSVFQTQEKSLKISFFDLSYKAINYFFRYALIILCLYNFILIKNQPFAIPVSVLNTMIDSVEDSLVGKNSLSQTEIAQKTIDFNTKICDKESINQETCLTQLNQLMQAEDLNALTQELGYLSPKELNLSEIVNFKIREFLKPYQFYLPYFLTVVFFSSLYFLATFVVFVYAFFAEILYLLLRKIGLVRIDIREVPQEYLV